MKTKPRRPARTGEQLVELLCGLSIACEKAAKRLDRAAHEVSNAELSLLFGRYARRRGELAKELAEAADQIAGEPVASRFTVVVRAAGRRTHRPSSALGAPRRPRARREDAVILSDCEQSEGALRSMMESALAEDLPGDLPMRLRRQTMAIGDVHDQLQGFCAALAWCAVPMAV